MFARQPVRVEYQRNCSGAIPGCRRRRFTAANSLQTVVHNSGPAAHVSARRAHHLVAAWRDDLHAVCSTDRSLEDGLLSRHLPLLIGSARRERVAGLIEEDDAAWRAQGDERVVFNFTAMNRMARHRLTNSRLFARDVATNVEPVNPEIE